MLRSRLRTNTHGDTIVEVMIAVAVLALIIGSGYAIASRSLKGAKQAQEHAEGLKIAEGQVEKLKARVVNNNNDIFSQPRGFCMDANGAPVLNNGTAPTPATPDTFSNYVATCKVNPNTPNCANTYCYHVGVRKAPNPDDTFTVTVRWDGVTGRGQDEVKLTYRIHQ